MTTTATTTQRSTTMTTTKSTAARNVAVANLRSLITEIEDALEAGSLPRPESLAKSVNSYAEDFGALRVVNVTEGAADPKQQATRLLLQGPDDTWSGRSNDARRAEYDGMVRRASEIILGF